MQISRHKAAIRRRELSLPVKCLLRGNLLQAGWTFFDYGCGHGEDVRELRALEINADGWDPAHYPKIPKRAADAVNLGYVLNVIEDIEERGTTLKDAWELAQKVLAVSARILVGGRGQNEVEYSDGILTRIGTFQKFYSQSELREYIEVTLRKEPIPAAPGVFFVFRDEELREFYLASRYHRRSATPRLAFSERQFQEYRQILEPLANWVAERGRIPEPDEFDHSHSLIEAFGSIKRAVNLVRRVIGDAQWEITSKRRSEDLLVYLALSHFRKRPAFSHLPGDLQRDIRAFFGTYKKACAEADSLLFRAGVPEAIDAACRNATVGKLLPNALYVHMSAFDDLEPLLRIYEGCARTFAGEIESANVIKLHRISGKVSYLVYPDFEKVAHPALLRSVKVSLRELDIYCYDYRNVENPPVLHRKETFLSQNHPLFARFAQLTQQEERVGLLDETASIGTQQGWQRRLDDMGREVRGHRLYRKRCGSD